MMYSSHPHGVVSTDIIRSHFPALQREHEGHAVAYFDGPGGTQVPRAVAEAMVDYLYHHNANTHWAYPTSHETDLALAAAREAVADFLNASPDEVAFGSNMTTLTFHLARALGRAWQPGDEVIVTELDHHANVAPWKALEIDKGIVVRTARLIPETGQLDWQHLETLVSPRTRLLAVGAASNALGTVNDIQRAAQITHRAKALLFVDAVHYAPHNLVDVRAMDCDFLACSAYKFYGPHQGILYGKKSLLEAADFPRLAPAPQEAPEKAETGTQNHEGIVGTATVIEFLASLAQGENRRERLQTTFEVIHQRNLIQVQHLWEGLSRIPGVQCYGPTPDLPRTATVVFTVKGFSSEAVTRWLTRYGVFTSHGDFYAPTVVERLGLEDTGLVRAGCACYTTQDEVDRLLEGVQALIKR